MADNYHSKIVSHIYTDNKINSIKIKAKYCSVTDTILQSTDRYAPEAKALPRRNPTSFTTEQQPVLEYNIE